MVTLQPWLVGAALTLALQFHAEAAAPVLHHQPAYQSPLRGGPDDLLLLPGMGFAAGDSVVYASATDARESPATPTGVPSRSTDDAGVAEVVSFKNIPYALTVRLPGTLRAGQPYALWVRNTRGEWSEPVFINDARPLWVSPSFVYASAGLASLPRYLKVVGRNLQPAPGAVTEIRLSGPRDYVLSAIPAAADSAALDHYVAQATLPREMIPGAYRVQVRRGGGRWAEVAEQRLEVRRDPPAAKEFSLGSPEFGACRPDAADALPCLRRAIEAARRAGGGTVVIEPGTWNLSGASVDSPDGIVLPAHVNLRGAGVAVTHIVRLGDWNSTSPSPTFSLAGVNTLEGIDFRDARVHAPADAPVAYLKLGVDRAEWVGPDAGDGAVAEVVITHNRFQGPYFAIGDSGAPLLRLFITYNDFGAYRTALELGGDRRRVVEKFRLEDSVVAFNRFRPGSHLDVPNRQGAAASELGASRHVDFSNNVADGAATDALYSADDARGWRAAYFWHMNNNQEMLLIAANYASCTGDKVGDGEAFALDNNGNTFALDAAATVAQATAETVTVDGPLETVQYDRRVQTADYYAGHWIQVGAGPGIGQARKIRSYSVDARSGRVTFSVTPQWDVVPVAGRTRIGVGREFWQTYVVANTVDHRRPLCRKSNRSNTKAGAIILWAQAADSAIEGNRQYDTDGIVFQQLYNAGQTGCPDCNPVTNYLDFIDIRGNLIDGEYDWQDGCSSSGIFGSLAAGPGTRSLPATVSYGLSISHNTVAHADGLRAGAIAFTPTWYQGPAPHRWRLVDNVLIFKNVLVGLEDAPATPCGNDQRRPRLAIHLGGSSLLSHTVLHGNTCPDARGALDASQPDETRVCDANTAACGCAP